MPAPAIRSRRVGERELGERRGAAPSGGRRRSPCGAAIATANAFSPLRTARSSRSDERARAPDRPGATSRPPSAPPPGCVAKRASPRSIASVPRRGCRAPARARRRRARARPTPSTIRQTLTMPSSAEARPGAGSRRGRERRAPPARRAAGRRCRRRRSPRSDGSAACSNEPFPVTNRRMNATSSGEALSPTTCSGMPARR